MSASRQQALIEAPVETVWELVADVDRHPDWWPRIVEIESQGIEQDRTYRQVTATLTGTVKTDMTIERLEDCREVAMRCLDTGMYSKWLFTDTHHGTFVDAEFGMDPTRFGIRVFDVVMGRRYFRRWLEASLDSLRVAAGEQRRTPA
jgi:ribosome-associated toxin RatA of RatAB toxin-antitoxin module